MTGVIRERHDVPGLPAGVWRVDERTTASGTRFFPRLHGRALLRDDDHGIAWFRTLGEACDAATDYAARKTTRWTLWGFHPAALGKDGYPYPVPLAHGTVRDCNGEQARRTRDGGWTMARYRHGVPPTGLRLQCDELWPARSHLGEEPHPEVSA